MEAKAPTWLLLAAVTFAPSPGEAAPAVVGVTVEEPTSRMPELPRTDRLPSPKMLAPELAAAHLTGGLFLGTTADGDAVIEYEDLDTARQRIASHDFLAYLGEAVHFDPIDTLIVWGSGPMPEDSIGGLEVIRSFDRTPTHDRDRTQPVDGWMLEVAAPTMPSPLASVEGSIDGVLADERVERVEPDFQYRLAASRQPPDDPLWKDPSSRALRAMGFPQAWRCATNCRHVVALLDSGVEFDHEDFHPRMWRGGHDYFQPRTKPTDTDGHGTRMAGIIAASGNNSIGTVGCCWNGRLMILRVFKNKTESVGALDMARAVRDAVTSGARIINCSWGGPNNSTAIHDELTLARARDVVVVAAAGNATDPAPPADLDDHPVYPACYQHDNIISVLATNGRGRKERYSNYGAVSVDIGAPGTSIKTTTPGGYGRSRGTSVATAHVSGAVALLWSRHRTMKATDIKAELLRIGRPSPGLNGLCESGKRVDVSKICRPKRRRLAAH